MDFSFVVVQRRSGPPEREQQVQAASTASESGAIREQEDQGPSKGEPGTEAGTGGEPERHGTHHEQVQRARVHSLPVRQT